MTATDIWVQFRKESEGCTARLLSKLTESWESIHELVGRQAKAFEYASQNRSEPACLSSLENILETESRWLLVDPIETYRRERPQQRIAEALDDWDHAMEGVIGAMPEFLTMTPSDWIALAGEADMTLRSRLRLKSSDGPVRVAFRQNLLYGLHVHRAGRMRLEGRLMRLMAQCCLELIVPWQFMVEVWFPDLFPQRRDAAGLQKAMERFSIRIIGYERQAARILSEFRSWSDHNAEKIANRHPLSEFVLYGKRDLERFTREYLRRRDFWARQARAVESDIDLALQITAAEQQTLQQAKALFSSVESEHRDLLKEVDRVVGRLENWNARSSSPFPPSSSQTVSAANRIDSWRDSIQTASSGIPESVEVTTRVGSRPRWRRSFRTVAPRAAFSESLHRQGDAILRRGLDHLERQHRSIVREIERAREVVAFASENAVAAKVEDAQVQREGIENARSLLEFHRKQTQNAPPDVERSTVLSLAAGFVRTQAILEAGRFGIASEAARRGLPGALRKLSTRGLEKLREAAQAGKRRSAAGCREILIRIGWMRAPAERFPRVVARENLFHAFGPAPRAPLPMMYQRLFRLAPVEDPRFLVGRQEEMSAFGEARRLLEHGRGAAALIVGEPGSGKTSLVNCAVQSALSGMDVHRTHFSTRLTTSEELHEFLAQFLGIEPGQIVTELSAGRRVIVLEELERVFLRRVNDYGAVRALLNLISRTSKHTLWIVSVNQFAFRLLNAALRLAPHFSHRINAMAVDRDHLREAILLRHNLSGLRLQFAPRPHGSINARRLRELTGVDRDPESEFFDVLYRESGGVLRTAFALWQRYVDRAEAGILYMTCPAAPNDEGVIQSLNDLDLFTLAAILQHGSLTPLEHCAIFQIAETTSHAWFDNLLARELVEPDPCRPGVRIVPEAGEIVRRTLFSRNIG